MAGEKEMTEATLELRVNSYRTAISSIDKFMSRFEKKDKSEVKECRWYTHYKNGDVLGDAMKDIYLCHKCNGKEEDCHGYEPYKELPLT